ncbi:MAG: ABC transporter permease [Deltaproteobacteria bacterium]|nr:ABC transporter permease [Deltaproteobacteria bacterium]MBW2153328.1 ABC transporter permease [Deltaproteobacteria bacterium]
MNERNGKDEILSPSKLAWRNFKRHKLGIIGALIVVFLILIALFGNFISPYDPLEMHTEDALKGPCAKYWLGTDRFGRDQLSRLISGTRVSMIVSFGSIFVAASLGVIIGLISGYYGRYVDNVIMRLLDIIFAFPMLLLALVLVAVLGPNLRNVLIAIGFVQHARFARIVRGQVLSVKEKEYIEGIKSVGARAFTVIFRFILPNVLSPIIVQATWGLSIAIMIEAALSFLGLGTQPPMPSWGLMLNESRRFMELAPWMTIFPGLSIMFAVLGFNLMGDALRDALDPRLSQR